MSPHLFQFFCQLHVILQVVLRAIGVLQITGVANRRFANAARVDYGVHRNSHIGYPIERIEYAEDIHTSRSRFADKHLHDVVRIIGITDCVARSQQHLKQHVGDRFAQIVQTLPRTFFQESHAGIKRRSAPHFQGKEFGSMMRIG